MDKFQGQEAPLVIYSMTTSTPEDAPQGMGVPVQPEQAECGYLQGALRLCPRGIAGAALSRMPDSAPDAAGECTMLI